ncbi:MAG: AMP-binding protein, partial [Planctomycetia bacterium]|nr:AMP-binding protein [Planctomycetia bacterium]
FGYTVPLWVPMVRDVTTFFHTNPLDIQTVGKLCRRFRATYFLTTPTFARAFVRRCQPEDLATIDMMILGAEKMTKRLADEYEAKFGERPLEGFGATELSPVVSSNLSPHRSRRPGNYLKEGTVGRPFPGVKAKIVHPETFEDLGTNTEGMLLISGDIVMMGYLNMPEETAAVLRDGWYVTGDMAVIDDEGFIRITGRLMRFSKLGGEMVPHLRLEEVLYDLLRLSDDDQENTDGIPLIVTAVPDVKKGERIVVLHTVPIGEPEAICRAMHDVGLPNLWIPAATSFYRVDEIPVLGAGKPDLRAVKRMALDLVSEGAHE